MTNLEFTKGSDGKWTASLAGFTGILQVDRVEVGNLTITGKTSGAKEIEIFNTGKNSTLIKVDVPSSVTLKIYCDTEPTLGQYEISAL